VVVKWKEKVVNLFVFSSVFYWVIMFIFLELSIQLFNLLLSQIIIYLNTSNLTSEQLKINKYN